MRLSTAIEIPLLSVWQLGSGLNTGSFVFDNNRKFIQFNEILPFYATFNEARKSTQ